MKRKVNGNERKYSSSLYATMMPSAEAVNRLGRCRDFVFESRAPHPLRCRAAIGQPCPTSFRRQSGHAGVPLAWAQTQNNLGLALRDLGKRTNDTNELCEALSDHVNAWQVFLEAAPHYASMAAGNAKLDVDAIHTQSPGSAPQCLQAYSADIKKMGVTNAAAPPPPS